MATLKLEIKMARNKIRYKFIKYEKCDMDIYEYAATAMGWKDKKKEECPEPLWFLSTNRVVKIELIKG